MGQWWTCRLSGEVGRVEPCAVRNGHAQYALFRDEEGKVRALRDECAHRRAPISLGRITRDCHLQCPYHGWEYRGSDGACQRIPNLGADEKVPRAYRVPTYAVAEQDGFVHIWDEADKKTAEAIPDLSLPSLGSDDADRNLVAFPRLSLAALLLDAPGAVIRVKGVRILNDHLIGDPIVGPEGIRIDFAASWAGTAKRAQTDYPFLFRVEANRIGNRVRLQLLDAMRSPVAAAVLGLTPVKRDYTSLVWRATVRADLGTRITIRPRNTIQAQLAADAGERGSLLLLREIETG